MSRRREELRRLRGRSQVRLGDDLDQRDAAAVVVDIGAAIGVGEAFVQRLPRVLLHVDAREPDPLRAAVDGNLESSAERQRPLVLRDLIALRQVRIEVVLAGEDRLGLNGAAQRQRGLDRVIDAAG